MGRPNKYETHVKPHLKEIEKMAEEMTEAQSAKTLGVSRSAWNEYKKAYPDIEKHLKKGKSRLVKELKSYLIKKAKGFPYEERKQIYEGGELVREEVYQRYAQPDTGAIHLLLKNYDESWRNDDQTTIELKKQKLELEKEKQENNNWG